MTTENENWKWWVGHDDERYHTECDTREEAVYIASEDQEGGYIVEAIKPANIKISRYFDGHIFAENAEDDATEDYGDPEGNGLIFDLNPEVCGDLEKMVRAAMDAWQEKHGLTFTGFQFSVCHNHEYVAPKPRKDQP